MARAVYVVSESTNPVPAEEYTSATYIFTDKATMENDFEPWYVDQHYLCIDSEGGRYQFVSEGGQHVRVVELERSEKWRRQCLDMIAAVLNRTRDWVRADLGIQHDRVVTPDDVLRVIADERLVKKLGL